MRFRSSNAKTTIVGGAGSLLSALWGGYSHFTTIAQLPSDAGALAKMLVDPPIYIPWLIFAACLAALGWSFWPSEQRVDRDEPLTQKTFGPQSHAISAAGDVHIHPSPAEYQPVKSPYGTAHLAPGNDRHWMIESIIRNKGLDHDARMEAERRLKFGPPPAPTRDVSLSEGLAFLASGKWGETIETVFNDAPGQFMALSDDVIQRARDGSITIWGRPTEVTPWEKVPSDHWRHYGLDALMTGHAEPQSENRNDHREKSGIYYKLMICRTELEKEWPDAGKTH